MASTLAVMTFDDLPDDWPTRPLTEPQLIDDVLDLLVDERARRGRCLAVLVCDEQVRLVQPLLIEDLPARCDPDLVQRTVDIVLEAMSDLARGSLLVALGRADGLSITDDDRQWVAATHDALASTGWSLRSARVITLHGSRVIAA